MLTRCKNRTLTTYTLVTHGMKHSENETAMYDVMLCYCMM